VNQSVAGLFAGQHLDAKSLLLLAVAGLRLLRLEVDRIDIVPMLAATRILVRAEPADLFLADAVLRRVGHELVAPSSRDASTACCQQLRTSSAGCDKHRIKALCKRIDPFAKRACQHAAGFAGQLISISACQLFAAEGRRWSLDVLRDQSFREAL
jgi:hypothetical protein